MQGQMVALYWGLQNISSFTSMPLLPNMKNTLGSQKTCVEKLPILVKYAGKYRHPAVRYWSLGHKEQIQEGVF